MDLWSPPHDAPHLLEWWRPLMLVSRRARLDRFPWPVHLDEFRLAGRVRRQGRPDVWIYDHHENRGSVCVDARGQTYRFFATPKGKGVGQFRPCELRSALWRARLPDVVEPVAYGPDATRGWLGAQAAEGGDIGADDLDDVGGSGGFGGLDRFGGPDADDVGLHADALDDGGPDADDVDDVDDTEHGVGPDGRRVVRRGHLTLIAG
jgi:hypothetical protein